MKITIAHSLGGHKAPLVDFTRTGYTAAAVHIRQAVNDSGQLNMLVPLTNPEANFLCEMVSELIVADDDVDVFYARVTEINPGTPGYLSVTAKGILDYSHDTTILSLQHNGTLESVLSALISAHNSKPIVDNKKMFVGTVTVAGSASIDIKSATETWVAIKNLITEHGGYIFATREAQGIRIDWLEQSSLPVLPQVLRPRAPSVSFNADLFCTVLYSTGKTVNGAPLTFAGINGGKPYITDEDAVAAFGWIEGFFNSSAETAEQLMSDTEIELQNRIDSCRTIKINSADANLSYGTMQVAARVPCVLPGESSVRELIITDVDWFPYEKNKTTVSIGASASALSSMIGGR